MKEIGETVFWNLAGLTSVTKIGAYAFQGCADLTGVTISDGVTQIGTGAFESCIALTAALVPDSVTYIGDKAFRGCSTLKHAVVGRSVNTIGEETCASCGGLFGSEDTCSQAHILTFLWRAKGKPESSIPNPYADLDEGEYYAKPAIWANEQGIFLGTAFDPDAPCTLGEIVTFLYRTYK